MIKWIFAIVILALFLWPSASQGQGKASLPVVCDITPLIESQLREDFRERVVEKGETKHPYTAELWLSPRGTWSFLFRFDRNIICLIASGHSWREVIDDIPILEREDR